MRRKREVQSSAGLDGKARALLLAPAVAGKTLLKPWAMPTNPSAQTP